MDRIGITPDTISEVVMTDFWDLSAVQQSGAAGIIWFLAIPAGICMGVYQVYQSKKTERSARLGVEKEQRRFSV